MRSEWNLYSNSGVGFGEGREKIARIVYMLVVFPPISDNYLTTQLIPYRNIVNIYELEVYFKIYSMDQYYVAELGMDLVLNRIYPFAV